MAWELWRLSKASGQTPWQAFRNPSRAFDITVMRAHDKAREIRFNLAMQAAGSEDPTGMSRVLTAVRLLYEEQ